MLKSIETRVLRWIGVDRYLPLQIDITNACNLSCTHCYHPHHRNEGALSLSDWVRILDDYDQMTARLGYRPSVTICGGEPLASPLLEPLLIKIKSFARRYRVSILTNGTLANTKVKPGWNLGLESLSFQVSVDGPDPARHDAIRGAGAFARAVAGARHLMGLGYPVHFLAVLSTESAPAIPEFFEMAAQVGVRHMAFTRLVAGGTAATDSAARTLGPQALKEAYLSILRESAKHKISSSHQYPLFHLLHPGLGRSGRFWEGLVVDYQGKLLASSRSRLRLGDVREKGLEKLFLEHPHFLRLRRGEIKGCGPCKHFLQCGGDRNVAWAETGDYFGRDPGCWLPPAEARKPARQFFVNWNSFLNKKPALGGNA